MIIVATRKPPDGQVYTINLGWALAKMNKAKAPDPDSAPLPARSGIYSWVPDQCDEPLERM
jgi:hypothetical protein